MKLTQMKHSFRKASMILSESVGEVVKTLISTNSNIGKIEVSEQNMTGEGPSLQLLINDVEAKLKIITTERGKLFPEVEIINKDGGELDNAKFFLRSMILPIMKKNIEKEVQKEEIPLFQGFTPLKGMFRENPHPSPSYGTPYPSPSYGTPLVPDYTSPRGHYYGPDSNSVRGNEQYWGSPGTPQHGRLLFQCPNSNAAAMSYPEIFLGTSRVESKKILFEALDSYTNKTEGYNDGTLNYSLRKDEANDLAYIVSYKSAEVTFIIEPKRGDLKILVSTKDPTISHGLAINALVGYVQGAIKAAVKGSR